MLCFSRTFKDYRADYRPGGECRGTSHREFPGGRMVEFQGAAAGRGDFPGGRITDFQEMERTTFVERERRKRVSESEVTSSQVLIQHIVI